ncbi:hypothetical protein EV2_023410 [Malus domestica]
MTPEIKVVISISLTRVEASQMHSGLIFFLHRSLQTGCVASRDCSAAFNVVLNEQRLQCSFQSRPQQAPDAETAV